MSELVQVMTMKVSKGLKFPVVALPGVGKARNMKRLQA